jgi:hypothetical protein
MMVASICQGNLASKGLHTRGAGVEAFACEVDVKVADIKEMSMYLIQ